MGPAPSVVLIAAGLECPHGADTMKFTAVYVKVPEGYIAFVEELPGANTQGSTLEEARANLHEAVQLVLEANRALAEERLEGREVIREPLPTGWSGGTSSGTSSSTGASLSGRERRLVSCPTAGRGSPIASARTPRP